MSKCTAAQAVAAMQYWIGYCEKANSNYSTSREKTVFTANAGSGNYTYAGWLCDCNGQSWCAAQVTTAITEACGESKSSHTNAKAVLHGVWPYINVTQVYDAAPSAYKGRRGAWTPKPGDIVIFDWEGDNSRDHTGIVESVTSTAVICIEGNSSNKCQRKTYPINSSYIWGYVRPLYADAVTGSSVSGNKTATYTYSHSVVGTGYTASSGEILTVQAKLYALGFKGKDGKALTLDGEMGDNTVYAIKAFQSKNGLTSDGVVGLNTAKKLFAAGV